MPATAAAGSTVNGSVTFANDGPSMAAGVTYTLGLPPGLSNVTVTGVPAGATATYNAGSGAVTFTNMPTSLGAGAAITLGIAYTAPPAGAVVVNAGIDTSTSQGTNAKPDSDSATTAVSAVADVTTTVTVPPTANAGTTVNATVTFRNAGPSTAAGVTYTMNLSPGLGGVTVTGLPAGASFSYSSGTGVITLSGMPATLGAGSTLTLDIAYTAPASGSVTVFTAIGTSTSEGANALPDSANDTTAISALADVTTTVSVPSTAIAGSTVNATATYTNNGPSTAAGVTYTLTLPAGLSNVAFSGVPAGATASYNAGSGVVTLAGMPSSLGSGSSIAIGVAYTAPASGAVTLSASIATTTSQGPNTLPDSASDTTAISPLADVEATVTAPATANAGDTINATVAWSNAGPSTAAGVTYTLTLTPGLSGVAFSGFPAGASAVYNAGTGGVTLGGMPASLGAGSTITVGVSYSAPASGGATVAATIGTTTSQGANTRPDSASASTVVSAVADVTTTVSLPASAAAGAQVSGTVSYANAGLSTAAGVTYTLGLPPGLTGVSFAGLPAGATASYDAASGAVTFTGLPASLAAGQSLTIGVNFNAPASGSVTANSAIGTTTSQGANAQPDTASDSTAISPVADVTAAVTTPASAVAGSSVTASASFTNTGPSTAAGVTYTIGLPPGLVGVNFGGLPAGATASYDQASGAVTFSGMPSSLTNGQAITIGIGYVAPASGSVTLAASIGTSTSQGANAQPDASSAATAISPLADVSTSVSAPASGTAGATINASVTYANAGPSKAAGVTYTLGLPPGLANVTFSLLPAGASASYDAASGAVTFSAMPATLASGATVTAGVAYTAPASGAVTIAGSIVTTTSQGPNTLADSASATTAISPLADVSTSVSVPPTAVAGSAVNGTVTYSNAGPSTAAGVTFLLGLPPGLSGVTFNGLPASAAANYDPATGAVTLTNMPSSLGSGSSITIGVGFTAPASGSVTVSSSIGTSTSQGANAQPDSANGTTAISPLADVTTTITTPGAAVAGSTVNATVTYSNTGPSTAAGVTYILGLPPGLSGVTFNGVPAGATAAYDIASGSVAFTGMPASLGAGSSVTVGIAYTAPASGSVVIASEIGTSTSQGPNTLPDTTTGTTAISPLADVTTSVTLPPSAVAGSTVGGSVTYGNAGPSTAAGVAYSFGLPPGLSNVNFSGVPAGATATYDAATGAVTFTGMPSALGAGSSVTVGVSFTAPASGAVTATSTIQTSTSQGANTQPDSASATSAISPLADVGASVSVPPTAIAGSTVNASVTFGNAGPSIAAGLTYVIGLPPGLSNVVIGGVPAGATANYDSATGAVTFAGMPASLGAGSSIAIGVAYTAPASGSVALSATIGTSTSQGPNATPDTDTQATAISPLADVSATVNVPASAVAGSTVNGSIVFGNAGPSTAAGVTHTVGLPPGLTNVTFSGLPAGATATYDAASGAVTFVGMPASLGAGSTLALGVAFTAPAAGAVSLSASIGTSTSQGANALSDTDTGTTTVSPLADVSASVNLPASAIAGSSVSGTVTFANAGPSIAAGVAYTLGLPPGLANVTFNGLPPGATATYDAASGAVTLTAMPASLGSSASVIVGVGFTAPAAGSVAATATIATSTSQGTNALADSDTGTTAISPLADVSTTISTPPTAVAGSTVNATVTFGNAGPSTAAAVSYTLSLAPGLAGVAISGMPLGATASYDAATGAVAFTNMPPSLGAGSSFTIGIAFVAAASGSVVIASSIATSTSEGIDPTPDSDSAATAISPVADVTVDVNVPASAAAGSTVNGTVTFSNAGPSSAAGVTYNLTLTSGLSGVVISGLPPGASASYNAANGVVTLSGMPASIGAGSTIDVQVRFTAPPTGSVTVVAGIGTSTSEGANALPDSANGTTAISAVADVTTSVSVPPTAVAGSAVSGTVTYSNGGPSIAGGVAYALTLPPGLSNVTIGGLPPGASATYNTGTGIVSFAAMPSSLGAGSSVALTVGFTAPASGAVSVTSQISTTTSQGANAQPDSATDTTAISPLADVTTTVTTPATATAGTTVNATITYNNAGPSAAAGMTYTTTLAPGLSGVAFSGLGGATATYNAANGTVTFGGMPSTLGAGTTLTIGVAYTAPNTGGAVMISSGVGTTTSQGPNTLPDAASATTTINANADVTTTVSVPASAGAGTTVNGSVTYRNAGPSPANGVTYTLAVAPGLAGVTVGGLPAGVSATYDPATGGISFNGMPTSLPANATLPLTLSFTAPASGSVTVSSAIGTTTAQGANTLPDNATATTAVSPVADVTTTIAVPASAAAGSTVSATVTFTNGGPSTAAGMTYTIGLPPGLAGVTFTGMPAGASATYDPASGAVTIAGMPASLNAGASTSVTFTFAAPASGAVVVSSTVGSATSQGTNTLPDTGTATTAISPVADVTTTFTLPASAVAAATVNGTVAFTNAGPSTAAGATYGIGLPPGLANVTFSGVPPGASATYNAATGTVTLSAMPATLNAGQSISIGVSFTAPANGAVTGTSTIGTSTSEGANALPDNASATTAISPLADVTTSITLPATATAGSIVNGAVTYSNAGPSAAAGITYTLGLPPGLTNVSFGGLPAGATAAYDAATGAVTLTGFPTTLASGANVTFNVSFTAPPSGSTTMASSLSTSTSQGPNTLPDNASATTAVSPLADVTAAVTLPATAIAGATVNGTVTFGNAGPSIATGVTYTLGLPAGLSGVSLTGLPASASASYNPASGAVTFAGMPASLGSGSNIAIGIAFVAPATGSVTVNATIGTTTSQGPNAQPDSASATTAISPLADVTTGVSAPALATAGATVNASVTFSNAGPSPASGVGYTLGLPPGLTGVLLTGLPPGATATYDPATGGVTFTGMPSTLGAGATMTIGVAFTAPATGSVVIASDIATATGQGPNTLPDSATATTAISPLADVTTTLGLPASAVAGSTVSGTVTFSNAGPSVAAGVTVQLGLPPGLAGVTFTGLPAGAAATYNASTGAVTFTGMPSTLGAGTTIAIGVAFTAPSSGSVVATSAIGTTTNQGTNTLPDSATAMSAVSPLADVTVGATLPATAVAGSIVNGSVTFSNAGPSAAAGVTYAITLPTGLAGVGFSGLPSGATATYNATTGVVTFAGMPTSLGAGSSMTLGVTFTAPGSGAVTMAALIGTSTSQGPNTLADNASATTGVSPLADVTTSVSLPPLVTAGAPVNGSMTFSNAGPSPGAGMAYGANLPAGLAGVTFNGVPAGASATYNAGTGAVTFTGLPATLGAGVSFTIGVAFNAPGTGSVTIATSIATTTGQGANTLPDSASDTVAISPLADVTTTVSMPPNAVGGTTVTASVTYLNAGPSPAAGLTDTVTLPPGLANVTFAGLPAGVTATYSPATGTVTLAGMPTTLGAGSSIVFTISYTAPSNGSVTLTSTIGTTTGQGPNTLPDSGSRTTLISAAAGPTADLAIVKTRNGALVAGGSVAYTITVTNNGPSEVVGAVVNDTAPSGVTFGNWSCAVTSPGSGGTVTTACGAASGSGNIGALVTMKNGAVITFTVPATVSASASGTIANVATVTPPGGTSDPTPNNNTTTETGTVTLVSDLSITKTSTPSPYVPGGALTYTIVAMNAGPSNAIGARIQDFLPNALASFTWTCVPTGAGASCGTASGSGNIDQLINIPVGARVTFTLSGTVPASQSGVISNTATLTVPPGTNDPTPNDTTVTNVNSATPLADLRIAKSHTGTFSLGQVGATYTIVVSNSGNATKAAGNIVAATDTPPAGITITAMSGIGWNCSTMPMCTRSDALAAGASYPPLTVTVNVSQGATSPLVNTADVLLSGQAESDYNNNTATDSTTIALPALADLAIAKSHSGDLNQGQVVRYSIVVSNAGTTAKLAGNLVSVTDTAPAGLAITAMRGDGWSCDVLPTCTRTDALGPGSAYQELVVIAKVAANASTPLVNSARVTLTGQPEATTANNVVNDAANVIAVPDLAIAKTHSGSFLAGQRGVQYTITVTNIGSAAKAAGNAVEVDEAPPFGLIVTGLAGAGWNCVVQPTPTCTRSDALGAGVAYPPIVVTADIAINAISPLFNGATVTLSGQGESEYDNNFVVDATIIVGTPIPAMSPWALLLMMLGLSGIAFTGLRRLRRLR